MWEYHTLIFAWHDIHVVLLVHVEKVTTFIKTTKVNDTKKNVVLNKPKKYVSVIYHAYTFQHCIEKGQLKSTFPPYHVKKIPFYTLPIIYTLFLYREIGFWSKVAIFFNEQSVFKIRNADL